MSFIGGAGLASLIEAALNDLNSEEDRNQHQKDVTAQEIRKCKQKIKLKNDNILKNINNSEIIQILQLNIISYLSSWSVNLAFNRINKKMVIYSLKPLFKIEAIFIKKELLKCLGDPNYDRYKDSAQKVLKLFNKCDIIIKKK